MKVDGKGSRKNSGKTPLELISPVLLEGVGEVLAAGAIKYEEHNWRRGMKWSIVLGSMLRHISKWMSPFHSDFDEETGLNHLHHAACNIMFLMEYNHTCKHLDDRFKVNMEEDKLENSDLTESDLDEMAKEELRRRYYEQDHNFSL